MSILEAYRDLLVDSHALFYMHSRNLRDILIFTLSKFKIYVSTLSLYEFLSYIQYKYHDGSATERAIDLMYRLYIVETINRDVLFKASMITSDLIRHSQEFHIVDLFNVSIAIVKNIPILTDDTTRYTIYLKYGITVISVEDLLFEIQRHYREPRYT